MKDRIKKAKQKKNSHEDTTEVSPLLAQLVMCNDPGPTEDWVSGRLNYVAKLELTTDDVPELLTILKTWPQTREWPDSRNPKYLAALAPIHAWRCLAQLQAVEAIPVMLDMLDPLAEALDDWSLDEFPQVFAYLGPVTLAPLRDYLADITHEQEARIAVAHGLRDLAQSHPQVRDEVVKALTDTLSRFAESDEAFNGSLIADLMELRATESTEVIERAFAADRVDAMCCGNWDKVRKTLDVEGLGLVSKELAGHRPFARLSPSLDAMSQQLREQAQVQVQAQIRAHERVQIDAEKQAVIDRAIAATPPRSAVKIGRNDPCPCGSGKKYKKCCAKG